MTIQNSISIKNPPRGVGNKKLKLKQSQLSKHSSESAAILQSDDTEGNQIDDHSEYPRHDEADCYHKESLIRRHLRAKRIESLHPNDSEDKHAKNRVDGTEGGISVCLKRVCVNGIDAIDDIEQRGAGHSDHAELNGNAVPLPDDQAKPKLSRKEGQDTYGAPDQYTPQQALIK